MFGNPIPCPWQVQTLFPLTIQTISTKTSKIF
jgi:hypothetical protein